MSQQIFRFDRVQTVNINPQTEPPESKTEPVNARFESYRLQRLKAFCFDHKLSLSDVLRDATDFYQALYPFIEKHKNGDLEKIVSWLNSMP